MSTSDLGKGGWPWKKVLYGALIVVAVGILTTSVVLLWSDWPEQKDWATAGQKGDYWGGHIAASSSFASAILFFLAILLQRDELKAQREALKISHTEMEASRKVFETQEKHMADQKVISIHSSIAAQLADLCRLRNDMIVQFHNSTSNAQRIAIRRRINASAPLMATLLNREEWSFQERGGFARLAGARAEDIEQPCIVVQEQWFVTPDAEDPI